MQLDSFNEIVEFALAREKEAVQFYMLGSQMINKPAIKKALLEMAEEESEPQRFMGRPLGGHYRFCSSHIPRTRGGTGCLRRVR